MKNNKYCRKLKSKRILAKRLSNNANAYFDSDKNRIITYSYNKRLYKKHSNKKIRNYKDELSNGNVYKRIFDLWWNIL